MTTKKHDVLPIENLFFWEKRKLFFSEKKENLFFWEKIKSFFLRKKEKLFFWEKRKTFFFEKKEKNPRKLISRALFVKKRNWAKTLRQISALDLHVWLLWKADSNLQRFFERQFCITPWKKLIRFEKKTIFAVKKKCKFPKIFCTVHVPICSQSRESVSTQPELWPR